MRLILSTGCSNLLGDGSHCSDPFPTRNLYTVVCVSVTNLTLHVVMLSNRLRTKKTVIGFEHRRGFIVFTTAETNFHNLLVLLPSQGLVKPSSKYIPKSVAGC
jgi:hypothetical protein